MATTDFGKLTPAQTAQMRRDFEDGGRQSLLEQLYGISRLKAVRKSNLHPQIDPNAKRRADHARIQRIPGRQQGTDDLNRIIPEGFTDDCTITMSLLSYPPPPQPLKRKDFGHVTSDRSMQATPRRSWRALLAHRCRIALNALTGKYDGGVSPPGGW